MKRQILAAMALWLLIPAAARAADISDIRPWSGVLNEEAREESSFIFDDGFGRLVEFVLVPEGKGKKLEIRQDRQVVWQEECQARGNDFSVVKREGLGEIYFLIELGDRNFHASVDRDDHWQVREIKEDITGRNIKNGRFIPL